ncbi:MAG: hypothetical protein ACRC6V_15775 [Bacteroidales bacterium]
MDTKIQSLTDKIYKEGVEKGNNEAQRIVNDAMRKEQEILSAAKAEAERIVAEAHKAAAELTKNTQAELKLFAGQAVGALKNEVVNLINNTVVRSSVAEVMSNNTFMYELMLTMAKEWAKQESVVISTSKAEELTSYFESKASDLLKAGVKIEKVNGKSSSFVVAPADGSYKITFGEEEFVSYFKEFLRPQLVKMLFKN